MVARKAKKTFQSALIAARMTDSFGSRTQGTARIFLLTKNSVVLADQKTGQVKTSVPLPDLTSVSVSTQSDGFFALKLKEVRQTCFDV